MATSPHAERAVSGAELSKRAMRFSALAYLSKRRLVPGAEATPWNFICTSAELIFLISMPGLRCSPTRQTAPPCPAATGGQPAPPKRALYAQVMEEEAFVFLI